MFRPIKYQAERLQINSSLMFYLTTGEQDICIVTDSKASMEAMKRSDSCDYFFKLCKPRSLLSYLRLKEKANCGPMDFRP